MQIKDAIFQGSRELFKEAPIRNIPVGIDWPSRILKRDLLCVSAVSRYRLLNSYILTGHPTKVCTLQINN